jgi:hypothetical protein
MEGVVSDAHAAYLIAIKGTYLRAIFIFEVAKSVAAIKVLLTIATSVAL